MRVVNLSSNRPYDLRVGIFEGVGTNPVSFPQVRETDALAFALKIGRGDALDELAVSGSGAEVSITAPGEITFTEAHQGGARIYVGVHRAS